MPRRRRNDAQWREDCLMRRGAFCRACGYSVAMHLQIDHMKPRSQGGRSDVENGLVLCGPFGKCDAHRRKTERSMLIERDWLDRDQVEYLDEIGWVRWNEDGEPEGYGMKGFAPTKEQG